MASAAEQMECTHRSKRQHIDHSDDIVQLPYEILEAIFRTLPTPVVVHRVGAVCKDWHSIVHEDELWRLRCGLSELPSGFRNWFAFDQRQTMREQALDHLYGRAGLLQNWGKGLQLLSVLSDAGDDYAMALYGWAFDRGVGVVRDTLHGERLLRQSKHSMARAWCLLQGFGVARQREAGVGVLNLECDTSDPHVQFLLGYCYQYGFGCVHSDAQAVQCYERAGNHVGALTFLGSLFFNGYCVTLDDAHAEVLFRRAAEQGFSVAQYHLACMYEQNRVVRKDSQLAKHWYTLAAAQGHEFAKTQLARIARSQGDRY